MRKVILLLLISTVVIALVSFSADTAKRESLREKYSRPPAEWPAPMIDETVQWAELGPLPPGPFEEKNDSAKQLIELGKALFFDTRLSGSGKISCASCHQPSMSWTDGKDRSIGHEGAINKRNSPTIQNTWAGKSFFWDGRSKSLEDQAFAPINSETEMHNEMPGVMRNLRAVKGYKEMFARAFGDEQINPDRLTDAIAAFEKTIVSRKSRFDLFLEGNKHALNNAELRGLHLFRTKARCMNCHNGPLFTDHAFHNNGQVIDSAYKNDKGRYQVTHMDADLGKFKTPSLRDVTRTGPWMHNGSRDVLNDILVIYNNGGMQAGDPLIRPLGLNKREIKDLLAFLQAISADPLEFKQPELPE